MTVYIGIDPGLSGAVAFLYEGGSLMVVDTPVALVKAKSTKRDYLVGQMREVLACPGEKVATLERGIAMPRQSSSTTYATGRGGGLWEGILAGLSIPYETVAPATWKKAMGIPAGSDKGASRVLASRLFPESAHVFARVKDDGRAEAALLAEYRRRLG